MSISSESSPDTLLLAIETSCRVGSVALARGNAPPDLRTLSGDRRHTSELMPTIASLLREQGARLADIGVLAWSCGPGSFTGLRIGATIARVSQSVAGCDVVSVPTLAAIAATALDEPDAPDRFAVMLEARRGQVYGAAFERTAAEILRTVKPTAICEPAKLLSDIEPPFWILGEGVERHRDACEASTGRIAPNPNTPPTAAAVAILGRRLAAAGRICPPAEIVPLYLRPPECEEVYEQRRAAARARRGE